jgi:hypothetical protein
MRRFSMDFEYVIIYKQDLGAKYSCIDVIANNIEEARQYALKAYSHIVTKENIVKVVNLRRC